MSPLQTVALLSIALMIITSVDLILARLLLIANLPTSPHWVARRGWPTLLLYRFITLTLIVQFSITTVLAMPTTTVAYLSLYTLAVITITITDASILVSYLRSCL